MLARVEWYTEHPWIFCLLAGTFWFVGNIALMMLGASTPLIIAFWVLSWVAVCCLVALGRHALLWTGLTVGPLVLASLTWLDARSMPVPTAESDPFGISGVSVAIYHYMPPLFLVLCLGATVSVLVFLAAVRWGPLRNMLGVVAE